MASKKKPITVTLDGHGEAFEALEITGYWNGWAIPRMTAEVAHKLADHIAEDACRDDTAADLAEEIRALVLNEAHEDGTVTINLGMCFQEPDEEPGDDPCDFAIPGLVL